MEKPRSYIQTAEVDHFKDWIAAARPNDKYTYHIGFGLFDSFMSGQVRKLAWDRAVDGDIYLVQRRITSGSYEYIAVKASNPPIEYLVPLGEPPPPSMKMPIQRYYKYTPTVGVTTRKPRLLERVSNDS